MPSSRGGDRRVAALVDALRPHLPESGVLRVPAAARAGHLAARRAGLAPSHPLVVVTRTDEEAHRLADDLAAWVGSQHLRTLPERAALPLERALPEHDESAERLSVLANLSSMRGLVLVAPLLALVQRTLSPEQVRAGRTSLQVGERIGQRDLLTSLVAGGYDPVVEVTGVAEFAHRGGLIDAWPPGLGEPVRIELFGDEIDSIRTFDPMTQASRRRLTDIDLLPASEFLPANLWEDAVAAAPEHASEHLREDAARLEQGDLAEAAETWAALLTAGPAADHVPATAHLVLTDPDELVALAADLDRQAADRHAGLVASGEIPEAWPGPYEAVATLESLVTRASEQLDDGGGVDAGYAAAPPLPGRAERAGAWLGELATAGRRVVVTTDQASRVGELLEESGRPTASVAELRELPEPGAIGLVHGSLSAGLAHEPSGLLLLTDRELFGATRVRRLTSGKRVVTRDLIGKLAPGDHVVHVDHGIARYVGMTQRTFGDDVKEYLQLDFAGTDKIFLPADQIGRITRYAGGPAPALSKLGGTEWERTKTRVRRAVGDLARELIEIYAARESAPGFAFSADTTW
ncbi:MAG: CarD family transcriptional regulator, partial [Candidatus Limnocylindria bacterium]